MKEAQSGSDLASESVKRKLEAKQFFLNQALPDFQTGYSTFVWVKRTVLVTIIIIM